jgi:hypothetical protein
VHASADDAAASAGIPVTKGGTVPTDVADGAAIDAALESDSSAVCTGAVDTTAGTGVPATDGSAVGNAAAETAVPATGISAVRAGTVDSAASAAVPVTDDTGASATVQATGNTASTSAGVPEIDDSNIRTDAIDSVGTFFGRHPPKQPERFRTWNLLRHIFTQEMLAQQAVGKHKVAWSKLSRTWFSFMFDEPSGGITWSSSNQDIKERAKQWSQAA